jgi:polyisoprenoid-binding protein YceI
VIVRLSRGFLIVASLSVLGCTEEGTSASPTDATPAAPAAGSPTPSPAATSSTEAAPASPDTNAAAAAPAAEATPAAAPAGLKPVAAADGKVALTPENTSIGFVGTHMGPKPDPRTGGFEKFSGTAEVDPATKTLKSATLEIQTDSVWTQFGKLTTHLKTPDFFDVREHPTAKFVTKTITPGAQPGEATIAGDLTLHGVTKPVSFPAKVDVGDGGLTVSGSFTLDRSQFGMDKMLDRVNKDVTVTVAVGKKTEKLAAAAPPN